MERRTRDYLEALHNDANSTGLEDRKERFEKSASSTIESNDRSRSSSQTSLRNGKSLSSNLPINVNEAARFLGVSPQTVYLWVERKQIPHFRVMGRNIRFLKSDLKPFRAQFKQEVENGKTT